MDCQNRAELEAKLKPENVRNNSKGTFINDVTQDGGGGEYFCKTVFKNCSKTSNFI